ncbi:ion transporter [Thioalkalivibrio sp. XN279]|uniref:ion transporter n=1 Tax=Thioalkalivibrio sp. XN279 TaxID=2714953 RepID=UPI001407D02F|nr:ion transporter [Thioalkalivibrio sp. XN279]NHA14834.1 ion transporter [Thioalkalivibrio sp. XN279]
MTRATHQAGAGPLRQKLFSVIFRSDTPAGMAFDVLLIAAILVSVTVVMLTTVEGVNSRHGRTLYLIEWVFTIAFTAEYVLRLYCVRRPAHYATSFFGIVDLLSILPTYLGLLFTGAGPMLVLRILRILRLFRVMHMANYVTDANILLEVLKSSWRKTLIFIYAVVTLVVIFATLMHFIEGPEAGFTSIPMSMYWGIVTLTTVGYGDITPLTPLGKFIATITMILGYGIIAVPMGIYFSEYTQATRRERSKATCKSCGQRGHETDARYCRTCGEELERD